MLDAEKIAFKRACSEHDLLIKALFIKTKKPFKLTKSTKTSEEARAEGNRLFKQKKHDNQVHAAILKYYCKSVAFALPDSEQLLLAYMNRSAFLLHICKFQESLNDIERALELCKHNDEMKSGKLLCRKLECLKKSNSDDYDRVLRKVELWIKTIRNETNKLHIESLMNKVKKISFGNKVEWRDDQKKALTFPINKKRASPDSIAIKSDPKYGRHLIAMQDFNPGQIIFMEKAFATMMNLEKKYTHCNYCLQLTWSGIPCDHCTWASFCSQSCKTQAWEKHHDIECSFVPDGLDFYQLVQKFQQYLHLFMRMLIIGIKNAGSIQNFKAELELRDKLGDTSAEVFCQNGSIIEYSLADVIILMSHGDTSECRSFQDPAYPSLLCLWIFFVRKSPFFSEFKCAGDMINNDEALFIGSLMMRLLYTSPQFLGSYNEYDEFIAKTPHDPDVPQNDQFSPQNEQDIYTSPLDSLINHSCYPNVARCFTKYGEAIFYAIRPIEKGSQIFLSYSGSFFYLMAKSDRQKLLTINDIICDCPACSNDWPEFLGPGYLREMKENYCSAIKRDVARLSIAESERVMNYLSNRDKHGYSQRTIDEISEMLKAAMEQLEQPSMLLCFLMRALDETFHRIYECEKEEPLKNCKRQSM